MAPPPDELEALKAQLASLTARVYRLEQESHLVPAPPPSTTPEQPAGEVAQAASIFRAPGAEPLPPIPPHEQPGFTVVSKRADANLEKKIGQYWLNRIGIVAILIGASYFLKYAFENNWVGQGGRIAIGLLTGIVIVVWSERFRSRGHGAFSYSLKAVGIGVLYLSLWAAFQLYHLIPVQAAFAAMVIVTAATIALALTQDAELLASFALIGGFSTPVLVSSGENHEIVLFLYVCLLDLAILVIARSRPWRRLFWGSFVGTVILYVGWYSDYYSRDQRGVTVLFAVLFAALFAAIPLVTPYARSTRFAGPSVTLALLPLLNAAALFLALHAMYRREMVTLAWYALILGAAYLGISSAHRRRFPKKEDTNVVNLLHLAIAIAFITVAIPLKLDVHWITIGWLVESAVLLWIGVRTQTDFLRYLAVVALTLGIFRLLVIDRFHTESLVLNARFATYLVAIAVLGGIVALGAHRDSKSERLFVTVAEVVLNLLALIALTREASDYFSRQLKLSYALRTLSGSSYGQFRLARDFSYSAIWLVYGTALMTLGFWKRSALVRWQALVLVAFTIGKVFIYDVSELERGYRILSFIGLGGVLLGISFVYQRDWLKLSARSPEEPTQGTSP